MNNWTKHNGDKGIPGGLEPTTLIEVETWTAQGNIIAKASELNWAAIKYYRKALNAVERAREELMKSIEPPNKSFVVITNAGTHIEGGYQAACQRATDLYKQGEEPLIVTRYSKPNSEVTE